MYDIAIVGAGASGMAAAISAKQENEKLKIVLIEALPRIGKKILATGNGRCNLTNLSADTSCYNTPAVSDVLKRYPPEKIVKFFSSIGLECFSDAESRVYPMSNMATSVLDCLRFEIERLKVDVLTDTKVESLIKTNGIFIINSKIRAKRVIVSTGGQASPAQGSDGSGYPLIKGLGHSVTPLYPGLVQLTVKENVKSLKGVKVKAFVKLTTTARELLCFSSGELLFTDYGLSGIAVMDVSREVKNRNCVCVVNVLPDLTGLDLVDFFVRSKKRNPELALEDALVGIIPKKLGQYIIKKSGLKPDIALKRIGVQQFSIIADLSKSLEFRITGTRGFENAQITVGGAPVIEFDTVTLESKNASGLYCTGELLNVDSVCGGYNLQWAWASGLAAGKHAANSL